ncbi:MAG: hypothetical protein AAFQ37_09130, partial [Bacteroidota bacterium]
NGNYIVGVRTSDSICVTIEEEAIELSSPDAPQIVSLTTSTTIGCAVDATGTITIEAIAVDGSALEYRLGENGEWSATTSYTNLGAGVYTIWVRKADGSCPVSQIVALNFDDVPAFSLAVAENSIIAGCDNQSGVIELIASGPQEALLYSLDGGATFQPEARFTGLPPGVYAPVALRLPMMGGDSCLTQGDLITILPAPVPAFEIEELNVPPNCSSNTGLLVFSVGIDSPNLQYSVDNGQSWQDTPVFEGLGTGAYMVAVRDIATGCTYLDLQQIAMNTSDATSINAIFVEQLSDCGTNDGSINVLTANNNPNETEISYDGGLTWTTDFIVSGLGSGSYDIVSRNISTGCTYAWYEPIIIDTLIAPSLLGFTVNPPSDCGANDGQLEVSLSDTTEQYILELNGPDFIFVNGTITDNLGEGVYDLTIRNADGLCALVFPDTVHIAPPFHTVIDSIETLAASNCDVQDAVISIFPANEDYEYSFDGGQSWANVSTQDSLIAQLYQIGIRPTAFPGCIAFEEVDLSIGYSVAVDWTVEWSASDGCEEEEPRDLQLLGATPDRLYSIDGGTTWSTDGTFTGLEAGLIVYISLAALDTSCINEAVDTLTVPLNEVLAVTIDTLIPPSCFDSEDGQIWLSANRPAEDLSFIWEDGTEGPELTGLGIGTYLATVSDGTCIDSLHIEIADETRISELLPGLTDTVLCGPTE